MAAVPGRKPLWDMTTQEVIDWLEDQKAELEDFCSYAQSYIKRRERQGHQTRTDERYNQFFERAADLIVGLAEIGKLVEKVRQAQERNDYNEGE